MSNICTVPLYSRKNNNGLGGLIEKTIKNSTLSDVVSNVASFLKKEASFATTSAVAEDYEKYEDNIINKLIPDLIQEIQSQFKTRFSSTMLAQFQNDFKNEFLPKTEVDTNTEEQPKTETIEEAKEKKINKSLKQLKNYIFNSSNLLSGYHNTEFSRQIKGVIIFNSNEKQRTLVYNQRTLNENLKQYKQNLYETIYEYCKNNNIKVPNKRSYYSQDNTVRAEDVLETFYKYLTELGTDKRFEMLEKCWEDITLGKSAKNNLLQATNAYITLTKFDELIKQTVGNYIQINGKLDEPINNIEHNGTIDTVYKYNFGRKKTNMQQNFGQEMKNALDTMGNFSRFLIESIPRINSTENLTQIQFINGLLHLKQVLRKLPNVGKDIEYKSALGSLHRQPQENWKFILDKFANESNYDKFIQQGLTQEDINIVQSIHAYIYGKTKEEQKNSLYSLENEVHSIIGYKELYPLVDTILGTIDSISEINYLETYWDYEDNVLSVRIKRKYFNNKQKLDLISGINQESSKPLNEVQKQKYSISYLGGPFKFKIGQNSYTININKNSEFGIFGEDLQVLVNGQAVDKYFKDINLAGARNRSNILNSTKGIEKEFIDLLQYIDKALTTGFSTNNESLQKFFIFNTQSKNGLKDLVVAASKVYLVKDLQRKFDYSVSKGEINPFTGVKYNKRDLRDWLKSNQSLVPIKQFTKDDNPSNRKFFSSLLGIPYIKPVQYKDSWVDRLGDAQSVVMGESLKAVTKNFDGQSIPNYSPAFLGADIWEVMERNNENPTTRKLLFSGKDKYAIKSSLVDNDIKVANGKHKQVKDATEAELQYHFFVTKFLIPFVKTKDKPYSSFVSQPTVYSDKGKFIEYDVSLDDLGISDLKNNELLIDKIRKTLGDYFDTTYNNIITDYSNLFNFTNAVDQFILDNQREPTIEELNTIIEEVSNSPKLSTSQVQNILKSKTLNQLMDDVVLYNRTHEKPIELIQDLHYRKVNGKLGLNETVVYRSEYVTKNLSKVLDQESFNYVNTLLNSGVIFDTTTGFREALNQVASASGVNINEWINEDGILILAKQVIDGNKVNIIAGEQLESQKNVIINPILEKYVLLHNLINNNIKEAIIGTDAIHKIKPNLANLSIEEKITLGFNVVEQPDLTDAFLVAKSLVDSSVGELTREILELRNSNVPEDEIMAISENKQLAVEKYIKLYNKINDQIRTLEGSSDKAQLKRTVTIPGTMHYYLQGKLNGILPTLRGAIMQDVFASVHNFEGEVKNNLEAHDGEAYLCPITAIYQNNSLQDSEVGDVIKPLWQAEVPTYGAKRLIKYAADTITNAMMRNSEFSEISMYHMFKKMTNISWNREYASEQKNLFNQYKHRKNPNVSFSDITQNSGALYYEIGEKTYQISGIGFDNGAYYTEEQEVSILANGSVGTIQNTNAVYFHYFDNAGNHYKIKEGDPIPTNVELHTIDSIYELHKVLGGIYSMSYKDGSFVPSDGSIIATADILNMVSEPTERCLKAIQSNKTPMLTQDYYFQPLKYKMIDYLINQSAIKNGTGNINFNTSYQNPNNELNDPENDVPLRYIEMDTQRYGIQQDSGHDADNEELTEMSQVISAIDAGGYYHQEVSELYKAIGHLALEASKVELSKVKQFIELSNQSTQSSDPVEKESLRSRAQNKLYDLIGRILIEHLSLNRGQNGIAESLVDRIRKNFGVSTDHTLDEIKIAFSDQTIYNQIISTIASILNKKSVKRKFPGTGQVMAPGYNIVQLWNIDGNYAKYEDLIKEAVKEGFTSQYNTPEEYNRDIVKQYLTARQKKYAETHTKVIPLSTDGTNYDSNFWEQQLQNIDPIDIVQCTVDGVSIKPVKLDKIREYYQFKSNPIQFLLDKGLIKQAPINELTVVKRTDIPKDLSPLKCRFVYEDSNGIKHSKNVYDIWAVKNMYFEVENFKKTLPFAGNDKRQKYLNDKALELKKIELRRYEQEVLSLLEKGIYKDENGVENKIVAFNSYEAQTLMSNIYKTKFGIKDGESLYDILKKGPERFVKSPLKMLPNESIYDLALLKSNGEGMLISFNDDEIKSVEGFYKVNNKNFQNISEHIIVRENDGQYYDTTYNKVKVQGKTINGDTIYSYIYSLDSNNMEVAPIAIKIDVSDNVEFDGVNFLDRASKKVIQDNQNFTVTDGKVLKTIQFVERKSVNPKHGTKYTVYNIKEKLLLSIFGDKYINEIISKLYKQDNYTYIMPARYINNNNLEIVKKSLSIIKDETIDKDIREYLNKFQGTLDKIELGEGGLSQVKGYNGIFKNYNLKLAQKVFDSFKESLYFISSRIPAQSLQSFMKMRVVGFTNSNDNIAYVTHWQAWLQGSDYDIDKSYMLGNEFDDNGLYQGWSPLFNFQFINASKKLPYPSGIQVGMAKENNVGISIEEYVNRYIALDQANDEEGKINLYNDLIRYINTYTPEYSSDLQKDVVIIAKFDDDKMNTRRRLIEIVNRHNTYENNLSNTEAQLKNFISNKLQTIIQGTSNFIGSHAPITMDYLHEAADSSSRTTQIWTTLNPGYIPYMQAQAMVGKKGVGIAANGQKAGFVWKYWMTDCINNDNPYKEFVNFPQDFHISRIEGRFGGDSSTRFIKRLPDINMYNATDEDKIFYEFNENHYIPSDQMSSQMISAATDNAKELILDVINANTDLSKVYMYLITLGFDVKDIVSFMTSPVIDLIARNSTQNIYLDTNFRTKDVANYILNKINSILSERELETLNQSDIDKTEKSKQEKSIKEKYKKVDTYSIDSRYSFVLDNKISALLKNIILEELDPSQKLLEIKQDIEEFIKIYQLSEEFSNAGRFLGMNGGIPSTKEDLMKFKKFIRDVISSREIAFGLKRQSKGRFYNNNEVIQNIIPEDLRDLVNNIDSDRYLLDSDYRYRIMRYYEIIKGSCNIPAMIEGTDQFKTILDIANILNTVDKDGITKSKAANKIYDNILSKFPYTDVKYAMQILPILNQVFISEFIESNPISIPVNKDWKYLSKTWEIKEFKEDCDFVVGKQNHDLGLTSDVSISSFHYLMDEYIIPALKNGELLDIKDNSFIQNLIPIIDGSEVRYKINIDMRAAQTNPESKVVLKNIINDLKDLQNYKFGNRTLLDIFMLYSLVVDQSRQGSDRLTDLFASFVTGDQDNLLIDYHKFMGEIELDNRNFMEKINNLSTNGFLIALATQVSSDRGHNEPSVKVITNDGRIDYRFTQGYGKYRSFGDFIPRSSVLESENDRLLRISNRERYKFGLIYDGYILDILDNLQNFENPKVWIDNFQDLMSSGNINLVPNCE